MIDLLPGLYDHLEPVALRLARRAAPLDPGGPQQAYLVDVARRIVDGGVYRRFPPPGPTPAGMEATLAWFDLLDTHLEGFVSGAVSAADIVGKGGGGLWEAFQARDTLCAVYGEGVARLLGPGLEGMEVLELGAGTGGTTRRLARHLRTARRFVVSDVRQRFLDRITPDLPQVPAETALVDINHPVADLGPFDAMFATNCLHVAKDLVASLTWLRHRLRPGGALVLGEGSHYSPHLPSPVSLVLSLFDGWWDAPISEFRSQPGFLMRDEWFGAFEAAGFAAWTAECWGDDRRPLGGVYQAYAPGTAALGLSSRSSRPSAA